jgi:hypothetical protein
MLQAKGIDLRRTRKRRKNKSLLLHTGFEQERNQQIRGWWTEGSTAERSWPGLATGLQHDESRRLAFQEAAWPHRTKPRAATKKSPMAQAGRGYPRSPNQQQGQTGEDKRAPAHTRCKQEKWTKVSDLKAATGHGTGDTSKSLRVKTAGTRKHNDEQIEQQMNHKDSRDRISIAEDTKRENRTTQNGNKNNISTEIQNALQIRNIKMTVLPPSFNYWNKKFRSCLTNLNLRNAKWKLVEVTINPLAPWSYL